jgi:hypothetical protein
MQRTILRTLSLVGLAAVFTTACGGGDDGDSGAEDSSSSEGSGNPTSNTVSATSPDTTVDTTMDPDGSSTDTETSPSTGETAGATAQVRVVHAAPGAGDVDVYVQGTAEPLVAGLVYGTATAYAEVPVGDVVIEIRAAGAPAEDPALYTSDAITVAADSLSTAVAAGVVGSKDEASAFRVLALEDAFEVPAAGTARVRILHAGADAPSVGIDVDNDGTPEIDALARFEATDAAGVELPADTAMSVGILVDGERFTQFSVPALPEGVTVLVAATGLIAALPRETEGLGLLPVLTDAALPIIPQDPRVYALHAFSGVTASAVDVCLDDAVLVDGLTWVIDDALKSFQAAPGDYDITLQADADDCAGKSVFGPVATGALAAGEQYLATVGSNEASVPQLILATEEFSLDLDPQAALRCVNASDISQFGFGTVDAGNVDISIMGISNGEVSGESELDPAAYVLGIAVDDTEPNAALALADVDVVDGQRMWIVTAGSEASIGGEEEDRLRFRIVDTSAHPAPWTVTDVLLDAP